MASEAILATRHMIDNNESTSEETSVDPYVRYANRVAELISPTCSHCHGRGVAGRNRNGDFLVCRCIEKRLYRLGYKSVQEYCESAIVVAR